MRELMISLDRNILDPESAVAERMRTYAEKDGIDILIPASEKKLVELGKNVRVFGTGGAKWQQLFRLLKIGRKLVVENQYDRVSAQEPFLTGLVAYLIRKKPMILEIQVHGDFFASPYFRSISIKNRLYYWLGRWMVVQADIVRVVGERTKKSVMDLGVSEKKIMVRAISIDTAAIKACVPEIDVKKEFPGFRKYFLYVGRFEAEKNLPWLLETFAIYLSETKNNDVLVLVGSGSQKSGLVELINTLSIQANSTFVDWVKSPWDYFKTADCVLLASKAEGYGLVPMEAAAAGTNVIMTDVGVAGYELRASEKVMIVPVNNRAAFIQSLKKI